MEMRPNEGLRSPFVQAKYWRQSRATEEIRKAIKELTNKGATFLAHCLDSVGPQHGDPVTNALPGLSWHQWGESLDCFWVVNGKAVWDLEKKVNGQNGFRVYAEEAKKLGLNAGLFWTSFQDAPHVQLRKANSPSKVHTIAEIDQAMRERFGG
ncbi:M15 family metallopeptidase [Spirosoma sp. KNUC1025]|nr:M15 family metallopeptidase [Spirosoma sp. KNUC1025]